MPPGLNATEYTSTLSPNPALKPGPVKAPACLLVARFHRHVASSPTPTASIAPFGLKATENALPAAGNVAASPRLGPEPEPEPGSEAEHGAETPAEPAAKPAAGPGDVDRTAAAIPAPAKMMTASPASTI